MIRTNGSELAGKLGGLRKGHLELAAAALLISAVAGLVIARFPLLALGGAVAVLILSFLAQDQAPPAERLATLALLAGAMVLGYGFANLGVRIGPVPLAITEILFLPLAAVAIIKKQTRIDGRALLPLTLFGLLVAIRLVFDFPVWKIFAIRDTTLALEAFILLIGYRAIAKDGVRVWLRPLGWVFLVVVLYGLVYPWRMQLRELSPVVGLQRPVPLLGSYQGVNYAAVTAGLFCLVFAKGWLRVLVLGLVVGMIGIFQARSLYVLFPAAVMLVGWATHQSMKRALEVGMAILVGVLVLVVASSFAIQGRLGPVSGNFLESHLKTLAGEEGPSAGTISHRVQWIKQTLDEVTKSPGHLFVGVGLGPDLAFGHVGDEGQVVRRPHNDYLEVLARTGILGLVLFLWLLVACIRPIVRKARSGTGINEKFCAWILASTAVYLGVAAVQPLLSFPYGTVPLFLLLGMGLAIARPPRQQLAAAAA